MLTITNTHLANIVRYTEWSVKKNRFFVLVFPLPRRRFARNNTALVPLNFSFFFFPSPLSLSNFFFSSLKLSSLLATWHRDSPTKTPHSVESWRGGGGGEGGATIAGDFLDEKPWTGLPFTKKSKFLDEPRCLGAAPFYTSHHILSISVSLLSTKSSGFLSFFLNQIFTILQSPRLERNFELEFSRWEMKSWQSSMKNFFFFLGQAVKGHQLHYYTTLPLESVSSHRKRGVGGRGRRRSLEE